MRYLDGFRDPDLARGLARAIAKEVQPGREYRLMEFCGGHTHAISRHGLADLLPSTLRLIHGPGCPVCVLPIGRVDQAIQLALEQGVILCSYGDTLRVPASGRHSLLKARGMGADVRMLQTPLTALDIARDNPSHEVVFLAIGFETTTPPTAAMLLEAHARSVGNLSILCNHVLTPPAMDAILTNRKGPGLDGIIGPAHVSTVIGSDAYAPIAARHRIPVVIAGFEPLDVLRAIHLLVRQVNAGRSNVENQFTRAVGPLGNRKAQGLVQRLFEVRTEFAWRGLGVLPHSALAVRPEFARFDAERRFGVPSQSVPDHKACECAAVVRGEKHPEQCAIFGTGCTPENPIGSCMVSPEGACAAHYAYGRFRTPEPELHTSAAP
jgi:hydrogenase expression/formation protein HypD